MEKKLEEEGKNRQERDTWKGAEAVRGCVQLLWKLLRMHSLYKHKEKKKETKREYDQKVIKYHVSLLNTTEPFISFGPTSRCTKQGHFSRTPCRTGLAFVSRAASP